MNNRPTQPGIRHSQTFQLKFSLALLVGMIFLLAPQAARADYTATVSGTTVTFSGDGNSDVLTLGEQGGSLTQSCYSKGNAGFNSAVDLDSTQPGNQSLSMAQVKTIIIVGGEGDDSLVINNPAGSVFAPNAEIFFDGQGGNDTLYIQGGGGADFRETYTPGPTKDAGLVETTNGALCQVIRFAGLEPLVDTVPAATLTVTSSTNANNAISYTTGSVAANGLIGVDNFETLEFSNKDNLVINALGGNDTISLNNPSRPIGSTPGGLKSITVNGGDPTASDTLVLNGIPGQLDNLRYDATDVGAGNVVNDNAPQPNVFFTGIEHLSLVVQQADGDGVRMDGTAGNDSIEFFHGDTQDRGRVIGTMDQNNATGVGPFTATEMDFTGASPLANDSDVNFFNSPGGTDTFTFNGTGNDDVIQVAGGEAGGTEFRDILNGVVISRVEVFNTANTFVRGLEGNDTFNVSVPAGPAATTIRIEGGDSDAATDRLNFTSPFNGTTTIDLGTSTIITTVASGNPLTFVGVERVNETSSGASSKLTVTGTAGDDTINVTPTGAGAGSFVRLGVGGSPLFTYTGVGTGVSGGFTINGGTGFDTVGILGNDGADLVNSTATSVTLAGGTIILGTGLEQLNILTFGGNDIITLTGLTIAKTIDAGAGNDTVDLSAAVDANIFGGDGDDILTGSPATDNIDGGPGNDTISGNGGNDTLSGGEGNDTITGGTGTDSMFGNGGSDKFIWNPGDGSDLVEGGTGTDELVFNGSAAAETFGITANGARTTLTRNVGAITMDIGETEQLTVNGSDGDDIFNIAPQATAHITIDGGNPVPPALPGDQLNIDFTGTTGSTKTPLGVGAGVWSFGNRQSVNFTGIETQGPAGPTISINNVAVTEGNSGSSTATFTATLSAASAQTVSVDAATANGTASAPVDYQSASATLTFAPGVTTANFNVQINGDTTPEGNETYFVNLTNPVNATISTPQGTGTINDDDATNIFQFSSPTATVAENAVPGSATVTVTRTGDTSGAASVKFETSDLTAKQRTDYTFGYGTVQFAPGETSKDVKILIVNDSYFEGSETFQVSLSNPSGNSAIGAPNPIVVTITDDDIADGPNPVDNTSFFVRQQYLDFLGREPDASGLAFWTNNIDSCGAVPSCIEAKRIDTSAAFFLSIEFQETSGNVLRTQRVAFGRQSNDQFTRVPYLQFMRDTRQIGQGVIIGQAGADALLEANKAVYAEQIVLTPEFTLRFPPAPGAVYVDALFASAGVAPTTAERTAAINAYGAGGNTGRIAALRSVVDSASVRAADFNQAFVLAQYYGYLRRNPTDAPDFNDGGYQFWLNKLNTFGGDFRSSEMVKSFILSIEYKKRFGP